MVRMKAARETPVRFRGAEGATFSQRGKGNSQAEGLQLDDSLDTAHIRAPRV